MTSSTELISQSPCSSVAECWWFKWLVVIPILGVLSPLKEGSIFPLVYIKLMVVLDDGRGTYGPRSVKLKWNGSGNGEWGEKKKETNV